MVQRIKVEERDAKLPFNTVDEALEFGSKKVAEFKEKRQLEMQNSQGFSQDQISSNNIFSTSLDDLNPGDNLVQWIFTYSKTDWSLQITILI